MALAVKTTTTGEGDSFTSVETADAYFAKRLNTKWQAAGQPAKEAALIVATDYIKHRFLASFLVAVIEAEEVPFDLQHATAEYALRALDGPLLPDPVLGDNGLGTVLKKKKIGPIEKEYEIVGNAGKPSLYRSYPTADALIAGLLRPVSNRVTR
jgi:hypothetical protein